MLEKALEMYRDYLYEKLDEVFEGTGDSGIKNYLFNSLINSSLVILL